LAGSATTPAWPTPAPQSESVGGRVGGMHGLLEQAVEEQPSGTGAAPVEAEGIFVEVVVEMLAADRSLIGAVEPALEQGRDAVHAWQKDVGRVRRGGLVDDQMIVADSSQAGVAAPGIREHTGPRLDGFLYEGPQGLITDVGHPAQANAPRVAAPGEGIETKEGEL